MTELEHRELASILSLFYREVGEEARTTAWNIQRYRERNHEFRMILLSCNADPHTSSYLTGCFTTTFAAPPIRPVDREMLDARRRYPWLPVKTYPVREPSIMDLIIKPEIELILRLRAINHMVRAGWSKEVAIKTFAIPNHPFFLESGQHSRGDLLRGGVVSPDGSTNTAEDDVQVILKGRKRKLN